MRYAFFSDVHGNLHALEKVLADIRARGVDRVICLGDLVGYGAFPNEVIDTARDASDLVIAGNHDHAAVGLTDISFFNPYAHQAVLWTRSRLTGRNTRWLREQPLTVNENGLQFVHASPFQPEQWWYIFSETDARQAMEHATAPTVFVGHTHVPFDYQLRSGRMINVGSAGQPRDGDPRAAWTLFDGETRERKLIRVEYDISAAADAIRDAGLHPFLADRLAVGR